MKAYFFIQNLVKSKKDKIDFTEKKLNARSKEKNRANCGC